MVSLTTIAIATIIIAIFYYFKNKKERYPPGPIPLPIIGSFLSLGRRPHLTYTKWAKKYGPIFSFQMGEHNAVVISDYKLIKEALNNIAFSGRPDIELFNTLGKYGVSPTDGQVWVEQRRFTLRNLRDFGFGKTSMEILVMEEVKEVISWLKKNEGKPISVQRKFNLSIINALWHILSGQRFDPEDKQLLEMLEAGTKVANASFLRILFPKLVKIFPNLTGYSEFAKLVTEFMRIPDSAIKEHEINPAEEGQPRDFTDVYINEIKKTTDSNSSFYKEEGKMHLKATLTDLFGAGSATTSETISWTVLYLIRHLDVQKKFQQEIDQVVGESRLPYLADRAKMPYTEAIINEVLRLSSMLPSSLFHSTMEDVEFHGYKLPKNTLIIPNVYSVHQDKSIWGDPENFRPERFLSADGKKFVKNEAVLAFSTGKRVCIGENLAKDELFLFLTSIFQKFNVFPDPANPKPTLEPVEGSFCLAQPYKIVIKERF